jgi:hypothetical protein
VGHIARMGERRYVYRVLLCKSKGKISLGGPSRRCVRNIKINIQKLGWGMDWIFLAQDRDMEQAFMH